MYSSERRSAISTSELGLYSDHSHYNNNYTNGSTVRKFVIGIMVVVAVLLIGIFLYDFASSAAISSKVSQETKHIYILQNSLRKPPSSAGFSRRSLTSTRSNVSSAPSNVGSPDAIEDRADDVRNSDYKFEAGDGDVENDEPRRDEEASASSEIMQRMHRMIVDEPEARMQNLENFKLRESLLGVGGKINDQREQQRQSLQPEHKSQEIDASENARNEQQIVDNHAMIYRVSRLRLPESETSHHNNNNNNNNNVPTAFSASAAEDKSQSASGGAPFRFELKGPAPASFKRQQKYPQLSQYRYPHPSRSIQDIVKYLTNDRGLKFTGYYVSPKKFDAGPVSSAEADPEGDDDGFYTAGDELSDEQSAPSPYAIAFNNNNNNNNGGGGGGDPLYHYKPKHPADVNLLAATNLRFSPYGVQRYNPYFYDQQQQQQQQQPQSQQHHRRPHSSKHSTRHHHHHHQHQHQQQSYSSESQLDSLGSYGTNYGKRRPKPKPFSVMLDIYPITDDNNNNNNNNKNNNNYNGPGTETSRKTSMPRFKGVADEFDTRPPRPRRPKEQQLQMAASSAFVPTVSSPPYSGHDNDEKHQMILHLNLYPKRKGKYSRNEVIDRAESLRSGEKERLLERMIVPFQELTKQLQQPSTTIDYDDNDESRTVDERQRANDKRVNGGIVVDNHHKRYDETSLSKEEMDSIRNFTNRIIQVDSRRSSFEATTTTTTSAKAATAAAVAGPVHVVFAETTTTMKTTSTTTELATMATTSGNPNMSSTTTAEPIVKKSEKIARLEDLDTYEGFQRFADSVVATD
ncbi:hypothetical protein TKK_0018005 [Trichogramma kaykai]